MSWARLAQAQDGIVTRAQLMSVGVSDSAVSRLARSGALHSVSRGVFLVRGAPLTYRARLWAAVCASGGTLAFTTAAHLWGLVDDPPALIDVAIDPRRRICGTPGVRLHRVAHPDGARALRCGLPVTTRRDALLDHLGGLRVADAVRLTDRALQRGWLRTGDLDRRVEQHPGRRGNPVLRAVAQRCGDGAAAESERVLHRLLRSAGIRGWVANHPLWFDGELVAVLDVAVPGRRLAIEIDGMAFHTDADRFQADRRRQNAVVGLGWTVLRFTWADLVDRPGYVLAVIRASL